MHARLAIYAIAAFSLILGWGGACVLWRAAELGDLVAPLEHREFGELEVVAIGTGNAFENPERLGPTVAVASGPRVWLVDAGRGVAEGLRKAQIPVSQPEAIFLTSLLAENIVGIDDLLLTGFLQGRSEPLELVGPPGTAALARALEAAQVVTVDAMVQALGLERRGASFDVVEVEGDWSQQRGDVLVRAAAISGGPLLAIAWKFENGDPNVVVSGAGWGEDTLVTFAAGTDLLVHEAAYIPTAEDAKNAEIELDLEQIAREGALHTSLTEVGALAARVEARAIALIRLRPPPFFDLQITQIVGRSFDGRVLVPADGDALYP